MSQLENLKNIVNDMHGFSLTEEDNLIIISNGKFKYKLHRDILKSLDECAKKIEIANDVLELSKSIPIKLAAMHRPFTNKDRIRFENYIKTNKI